MNIEKCRVKQKCDFIGCNNIADYSLNLEGSVKRDLSFCDRCLKEMYEAIGKVQIPKGVSSPFKLNKRLKEGNK